MYRGCDKPTLFPLPPSFTFSINDPLLVYFSVVESDEHRIVCDVDGTLGFAVCIKGMSGEIGFDVLHLFTDIPSTNAVIYQTVRISHDLIREVLLMISREHAWGVKSLKKYCMADLWWISIMTSSVFLMMDFHRQLFQSVRTRYRHARGWIFVIFTDSFLMTGICHW